MEPQNDKGAFFFIKYLLVPFVCQALSAVLGISWYVAETKSLPRGAHSPMELGDRQALQGQVWEGRTAVAGEGERMCCQLGRSGGLEELVFERSEAGSALYDRQLEVSHSRNGQSKRKCLESRICLRTSRKPVWLRPREQVRERWKSVSREVQSCRT